MIIDTIKGLLNKNDGELFGYNYFILDDKLYKDNDDASIKVCDLDRITRFEVSEGNAIKSMDNIKLYNKDGTHVILSNQSYILVLR